MVARRPVEDIRRDVCSYVEARCQETAQTIRTGASPSEISEVESTLGVALPSSFRAYLRCANGQHDPAGLRDFTGAGRLLSTTDIISAWCMLRDIDTETRSHTVPELERSPGLTALGPMAPWWRPTLVPFGDCDGNTLCIDVDSSGARPSEEIVWHVHDFGIERGVAPDFHAWLLAVLERLKAGGLRVEPNATGREPGP